MPERKSKRELEAIWRQKLNEAEEAYGIALANIEKIQAEYKLMPTSDGNFALQQALNLQELARDEYTKVLQTFTRLVLYGEEPKEVGEATAPARPVNDVDIQEWVSKHHGFVPHPSWIAHCRELYLNVPSIQRSAWNECPPDKREAIRQAFVALGLLRD